MTARAPAFQFYANDWLSSTKVALMTPAQEGAYIRLLCHAWNDADCSIPDNDDELAVLSRLGEEWFKGGSTVVRRCFENHPKVAHRLINKRLFDERKKQEKWRKKSSDGGKKSAKTRAKARPLNRLDAGKGGSQMVATNRPTSGQPNGNSSSSSSSSSSERERDAREKQNSTQENPLTHPLGIALLEGAGFSADQREMLSPKNYTALGGAITRLTKGNVSTERIAEARKSWWGKNPPTFDQLADEALRTGNFENQPDGSPKIEMAPDWYADLHKGVTNGS